MYFMILCGFNFMKYQWPKLQKTVGKNKLPPLSVPNHLLNDLTQRGTIKI